MKTLLEYILENKLQSTVYILCGLPGSGKSTYCKKELKDVLVISRDIIRKDLGYTKSVDQKAKLSKEQEDKVTEEEYKRIDCAIEDKKDFAIDDINVTPKYRTQLIDYLKKHGCKVIGINIDTDVETCIDRRKGQIKPKIMYDIAQRMVKINQNEVDKLINIKGTN